MTSHTFTRQELYDLVWSEAMTKVAARFDISGRGLAKACEKAGIPVPERGYWAKLHAGRRVQRSPLPPPPHAAAECITISPPGPRLARPEQPPLPPTIQAKIDEELKPELRVRVPATLSHPHRIITAWLQDDRREREKSRHDSWLTRLYEPIDKTTVAKRRLRILHTLFKALETRGYRLVVEGPYRHEVLIASSNEKLAVALVERKQQFRRYLTDEEVIKQGDLSTGRKWTQEKKPTGELSLTIKESGGHGIRKEWRDAPERPIEDEINTVLGGIAGIFEEIRLRHEREAKEREKQWAIAERQHKQEMERKRETIRFRHLLQKCDDRTRACDIRALVAEIEMSPLAIAKAEMFALWKTWALDHADSIDPRLDENLFDLEVSDSDVDMLDD